jgi:flagellar biosynthetic protein FliP
MMLPRYWILLALFIPTLAGAADISFPGVDITVGGSGKARQDTSTALQVLFALTVLSLAPAILVMMTSFTRIVIVLSLLRQALGTQETPPNSVLISLALFLTLFTMMPSLMQANEQGLQPYLNGRLDTAKGLEKSMAPIRDFMIRQTREEDLALMIEVSKSEPPKSIESISNVHLIPAFMLSELKTAFQIGFVIFLPFLLVDLVVASILMSMGMLMVPPMMLSLPIKILMFVLIDGWNLIVKALLGSFH